MKTILCSLLVVATLFTALVAFAPAAKADDCGYWTTRYEQVYVPARYLGVDLYGCTPLATTPIRLFLCTSIVHVRP
jgi:hypothetical protein